MTANVNPIYTLTPNIGHANVTAANTNSDGTGNITTPTIFVAFTAGTNGSWVARLEWHPVATAAATNTTQTVGRSFISTLNTGATTGGTNTWAIGNEVNLAVVSADATTAPVNPVVVQLGFAIPSGTFILVSNHAAPAANTNWQATVIGGDY